MSALLLGGCVVPAIDLGIELVGILLLVLTRPAPAASWQLKLGYATAILIALVPLLQLLPLPWALWSGLPGRTLPVAILAAGGAAGHARAFSLDPDATIQSALYLIPAIAMFMSVVAADHAERRRLTRVALGGCLFGLLLGALQTIFGGPYLFPTPHEGAAVGIFLNRNHQADLLLIGLALVPAVARDWRSPSPRATVSEAPAGGRIVIAVAFALVVALALAVFTTTSRAGAAIMPLVLLASVLRLLPPRRRAWPIVVGGVAIVVAGLGFILMTSGVAQHGLARFADAGSDLRLTYWADTIYAIRGAWPLGTGIGTFVPVYATVETLASVGPAYVNHAHNDYLELLLECGVASVIVMPAYAVAVAGALRLPGSDADRRLRGCALVAILALLLHSAVDYPLRTLALMTVFGLLHGLLFPSRGATRTALL